MDNNTNKPPGNKNLKNVLLIGTSNVKFLSARTLAGDKFYVKKDLKYSTKDASRYIEDFEGVTPDVITLLTTCNDVESDKAVKDLCDEVIELVDRSLSKFGNKSIIVSTPLPNKDRIHNETSLRLTEMLTLSLKKYSSVRICYNNNLRFRGKPLNNAMYDRKHLSKWGTDIFTENLRAELNLTA